MSAEATGIEKIVYEQKLARYLWGIFITATILFIIGKIIGYLDFVSWVWIIAPFAVSMIGAIFNYLDWTPNARILLYTIGIIYGTLRFAILRIVLWMPIFIAFFNGYCILKKYGTGASGILLSSGTVIITYFIVIKFSGRSPGMPK
jgi:hypothetical protein